MKKLLFTISLISVVIVSNAQELLSKKGTPILPEAKDWSIGFNADFLIGYIGNMFHGQNATDPAKANYQVPNTFVGKYMKTESMAYLVILRIGNVSTKISSPINDQNSTATPQAKTTDTWKNDSMTVSLGFGIQKFRGKGRLKGVYGGTLSFIITGKKDTYTYGNAIDADHPVNGDNTSPGYNSTDFGKGISGVSNISTSGRATESKRGTGFGAGVRAFIGAEYFFAPKMSVGAQYGWGIQIMSVGQGQLTYEYWDGTKTTSTTEKSAKGSSFGVDVDNMDGQIVLALYF